MSLEKRSVFSKLENKPALRNYSWMDTELNSEVVGGKEPPNSSGQMDKRLGESTLELPWRHLISVSRSVFSPGVYKLEIGTGTENITFRFVERPPEGQSSRSPISGQRRRSG